MTVIERNRKSRHHGPRKFREDAFVLLKREVVRINTNGTRQGFKFAERMFAALPESRNA